MAAKLSADPDTRIITITEPPIGGFQTLDVVDDIYSPLKEDWLSDPVLQKVKFPLREQVGQDTGKGKIGPYVFIFNHEGWRVLPHDSDHELTVVGGNLRGQAAVEGIGNVPIWNARPGRTIIIPLELSAQALTRETGVSGLTGDESTKLDSINGHVTAMDSEMGIMVPQLANVEIDVDNMSPKITSIDSSTSLILTTTNSMSLQLSGMEGVINTLNSAQTIEGSISQQMAMRIMLASICGRISGAPNGPIVVHGVADDSKERMRVEVDGSGNRLVIIWDMTP